MGKNSIDPKMIDKLRTSTKIWKPSTSKDCVPFNILTTETSVCRKSPLAVPKAVSSPSADPCSRVFRPMPRPGRLASNAPRPISRCPCKSSWLDDFTEDVLCTSCVLALPGLIESHSTPLSPVDWARNEWHNPASSVNNIAINSCNLWISIGRVTAQM